MRTLHSTVTGTASLSFPLLLFSSTALATVLVHVDRVDFVPGQDQVVMINVWLEDTTGENEQLNAFTVAVDGPAFTPEGFHFLPPARRTSESHPYVFEEFTGVEPEDFGSTYNRLQIGAGTVGRNDNVDVTPSRNGLFEIPLFVPATFEYRPYPIIIDPTSLSLGGAGEPILAAPSPGVGGLNIIPEPSAVAIAPLALLLLWRRR